MAKSEKKKVEKVVEVKRVVAVKPAMNNEKLKATLTVFYSMIKNGENHNDETIKMFKQCMDILS